MVTKADKATWRKNLESNFRSSGTTLEAVAAEVGIDLSGPDTEARLNALSYAHDLLYWGAEIVAARQAERAAMDNVRFYVREGDQAGLPKAWMARAAGVSRQTVYEAVNN